MTLRKDEYEDKVIAMLGVHLSNGVKDFGKIVDYIKITENLSIRYVFVTDTGRKIDSGSAMRFINNYRRQLENRPAIVYPDGTDTVLRRRKMRVRRSGSHSVTGSSIANVADIGNGETINISSTVTSAGAFPEEMNLPKGKSNPNGLTIDEILEKSGITVNEYFASRNNETDNGDGE
jgi:hypothetical protein